MRCGVVVWLQKSFFFLLKKKAPCLVGIVLYHDLLELESSRFSVLDTGIPVWPFGYLWKDSMSPPTHHRDSNAIDFPKPKTSPKLGEKLHKQTNTPSVFHHPPGQNSVWISSWWLSPGNLGPDEVAGGRICFSSAKLWRCWKSTSGQGKKVEKISVFSFLNKSLHLSICSLFMCLFWYTFLRWLSTCFFSPLSLCRVTCDLPVCSQIVASKSWLFPRPGHERHYPNHVPWISAATEEVDIGHWYLGRITTHHITTEGVFWVDDFPAISRCW